MHLGIPNYSPCCHARKQAVSATFVPQAVVLALPSYTVVLDASSMFHMASDDTPIARRTRSQHLTPDTRDISQTALVSHADLAVSVESVIHVVMQRVPAQQWCLVGHIA